MNLCTTEVFLVLKDRVQDMFTKTLTHNLNYATFLNCGNVFVGAAATWERVSTESSAFYIQGIWHFSFCLFQGVQERANLTSPMLSKEDPIFSSLSHKLGHSVDEVGHRIHQALMRVRSASYNHKDRSDWQNKRTPLDMNGSRGQ